MIHETLLRGLPEGGVMWLVASGQSLWPFLLDGDSLRVERVLTTSALKSGDVAVVKLPSGIIAAHLVVAPEPLQTSSSVGVLDPLPLEPLGRVTAFRRAGVVVPWVRLSRHALRFVPPTARVLRHVPGLRALVRGLRSATQPPLQK